MEPAINHLSEVRERSVAGSAEEPFHDQLDRVAEVLEETLAAARPGPDYDPSVALAPFFDALRATDLPFIPLLYRDDPATLFRLASSFLLRIGSISPAVALALENHLYVLAAVATLPVDEPKSFKARRDALVEMIRENRMLVANTNSRVHGGKVGKVGTRAERHGDGYRVSGSAAFLSLASQGDLMLFLTQMPDGAVGIFVTRLKGNPAIEIGDLLFKEAMVDSDTRRVAFKELELQSENLLMAGRNQLMATILTYQLSWHQVLYTYGFLGAAARAIDEARQFLRQVQGPDGKPLAELDGQLVDSGRLAIEFHAARALAERAGAALATAGAGPLEPERLSEIFDLACAAKYAGTRAAERIVARSRTIIGARAFAGKHPLVRLTDEVVFGQLGGEVNAFVERRLGNRVLGEGSFLDAVAGAVE